VRFLATLALALGLALAATSAASADEVVRYDRAGRAIAFDVRTGGVNVNWYARFLRNALHGDEISDVVIRIVSPSRISALCGRGSDSCYNAGRGGATVVVPAGRSRVVAHLLVHEYGHHLDASYGLLAALEHDWYWWRTGARAWWSARGLARLLAHAEVTWGYRLGWSRSIDEIFAEDYARLAVGDRYLIGWLGPPRPAALRALRRDIARGIATDRLR
jgi:hypothetical protein